MTDMQSFCDMFPDCPRCQEFRLKGCTVTNNLQEEAVEGAYAKHLMEDHKLSRLEICERTGVFVW